MWVGMKAFRTHTLLRREARDSGLSLVELCIYVVVFGLIMGTVLTVMLSFQESRERNESARSSASRDAILTSQLTRDIQQSTWLHTDGDSLRMRVADQCVTWWTQTDVLYRTDSFETREFGKVSPDGGKLFNGTDSVLSADLVAESGLVRFEAVIGDKTPREHRLSVRHTENGEGPAC